MTPDPAEAVLHAERAANSAHEAARTLETQLADALLPTVHGCARPRSPCRSKPKGAQWCVPHRRYSDEERERLCEHCAAFSQLRRSAESYLQSALNLLVSKAQEAEVEAEAARAAEATADAAERAPGRTEQELLAELGVPGAAAEAEAEAEAADAQDGSGWFGRVDVDEQLQRGRWTLDRISGGHRVYKRKVVFVDVPGLHEQVWNTAHSGVTPSNPHPTTRCRFPQNVSMSASPSDHRAWRAQLRDLRQRDMNVLYALPSDVTSLSFGGLPAQAGADERAFDFARLFDLQATRSEQQRSRQQMDREEQSTLLELAELESALEDFMK